MTAHFSDFLEYDVKLFAALIIQLWRHRRINRLLLSMTSLYDIRVERQPIIRDFRSVCGDPEEAHEPRV